MPQRNLLRSTRTAIAVSCELIDDISVVSSTAYSRSNDIDFEGKEIEKERRRNTGGIDEIYKILK